MSKRALKVLVSATDTLLIGVYIGFAFSPSKVVLEVVIIYFAVRGAMAIWSISKHIYLKAVIKKGYIDIGKRVVDIAQKASSVNPTIPSDPEINKLN